MYALAFICDFESFLSLLLGSSDNKLLKHVVSFCDKLIIMHVHYILANLKKQVFVFNLLEARDNDGLNR